MPAETYIAIALFVAFFGGFALLLAWARWYAERA
jgi:hypothetical protein